MSKIILADTTSYEISEGASLQAVELIVDSYSDLKEVESALKTSGNLESVQFSDTIGVTGEYQYLKLTSDVFDSVKTDGDKVKATIRLTNMSDLEISVLELQKGQSVQDGAIADLGTVVSDIAGGE
ncbi:MAG TPA: hypothetical protein H9909_03775 [Candidatus Mediterraneibacter norfolkensis]|nr:hypothetical protein [Candidatus Mediterraneibacter norfolkensis]